MERMGSPGFGSLSPGQSLRNQVAAVDAGTQIEELKRVVLLELSEVRDEGIVLILELTKKSEQVIRELTQSFSREEVVWRTLQPMKMVEMVVLESQRQIMVRTRLGVMKLPLKVDRSCTVTTNNGLPEELIPMTKRMLWHWSLLLQL